MNQKGYLRLYTFMALILIVSLACTGGVATPTLQVPLRATCWTDYAIPVILRA